MGWLLKGEQKGGKRRRGEPHPHPGLGGLWDGAPLWTLFLPKKEHYGLIKSPHKKWNSGAYRSCMAEKVGGKEIESPTPGWERSA